jgi:hypothetical protein
MLHSLILFITRAQRHVEPFRRDLAASAHGAEDGGGRVVGRDRQPGDARVDDGQRLPFPLDLDIVGIDPAFVSALNVYPMPIVLVGASDQHDVGAFAKPV